MSFFNDKLIFSSLWAGRPMPAQEISLEMRRFLDGLARISPWSVPFDVSGTTKTQSYLEIAEDWSNFEEIVYQAIDNKEVRFFSETEPKEMRLRPDSKTVYGMRASFSDYIQKKQKKNAVVIRIGMGSTDLPSYGSVSIEVPFYMPGETNMAWSMSKAGIPEKVFDYLIDFSDPLNCYLYSSTYSQEVFGLHGRKDLYELGWLTYTKNEKVKSLLSGDPCVEGYKNGILIRLGKDVSVFCNSKAKENAIRIRDKLRKADLLDWRK